MAEADLTAWSEFPYMNCGVLISCLAALVGKDMRLWMRPLEVDWLGRDYEGRRDSLARLAYDWFFGAARLALTAKDDDFCLLNAPQFKERENVSDYLNRLGGGA